MQIIEQNISDNNNENDIDILSINKMLEHTRSRKKVAKELGLTTIQLNKKMKVNNLSYNIRLKQFIINKKEL